MAEEESNAKVRPMSGFFAGLSAEQKKKALEYRGEESHGDKTFRWDSPQVVDVIEGVTRHYSRK